MSPKFSQLAKVGAEPTDYTAAAAAAACSFYAEPCNGRKVHEQHCQVSKIIQMLAISYSMVYTVDAYILMLVWVVDMVRECVFL